MKSLDPEQTNRIKDYDIVYISSNYFSEQFPEYIDMEKDDIVKYVQEKIRDDFPGYNFIVTYSTEIERINLE